MPCDHIRQKLWEAVGALVHQQSIQDRLEGAAILLIQLAPGELEQLPEDVRTRFDAVMHALTKHPAERPGEGSISASVRKLTDEESGGLANEIFSIYVQLRGGI